MYCDTEHKQHPNTSSHQADATATQPSDEAGHRQNPELTVDSSQLDPHSRLPTSTKTRRKQNKGDGRVEADWYHIPGVPRNATKIRNFTSQTCMSQRNASLVQTYLYILCPTPVNLREKSFTSNFVSYNIPHLSTSPQRNTQVVAVCW